MSRRSVIYGGSATNENGNSVPMVIDNGTSLSRIRSGFVPDRLDAVITTLIDNADSGARLLQTYTPLLSTLMQALQTKVGEFLMGEYIADGEIEKPDVGELVDLAEKVSLIMERVNRMSMNAVRAKDDAMRLQKDLAGDQGDGNLHNLSENALRRLVSEAAEGWVKPDDGD